jgi:Asp-tRNA(Asn)/Glu-tRNA(Gln) amidotransferase A subunit family amidase
MIFSFTRLVHLIIFSLLMLDDPEYFKGAPINLQVVGKPWEDEKVLAAMQIIEDALAA